MSKNDCKNPFSLSYTVLRSGTASFNNATTEEISKSLNRVGHCCLNVFATTALFIALMVFADPQGSEKTPTILAGLYALAMWMQLATVRHRVFILLLLTVVIELVIFGLVTLKTVNFFFYREPTGVKDYVFAVLFLLITVIRLVYILILFKVLKFKNPHFALSTTVFLKPTNTPVTFSSVMAPQELDPTNPYYPQTVYNNNQVKNNLLDKSLT